KIVIKPEEPVQQMLENANGSPLKEAVKAYDMLKRPEVTYKMLEGVIETDDNLPDIVKEQVEIQIKYEGYIKKANEQVDRMLKMENKKIPDNIDYDDIDGIAFEAKEKLKRIRPRSEEHTSELSEVNT